MMHEQGSIAPPIYDAWAHGSARPVAIGHTGTSASGWLVRRAGQVEELERKVIASRSSNRWAWEAAIMAVLGVVEFVENGSIVLVRLKDEALVNAIIAKFIRTDGRPMAGQEFWFRLATLAEEKGIGLKAVKADKTDRTMALLADEVVRTAQARLDSMGEREALANTVGPRKRRGRFSFGKVEGYEEKPMPIRRRGQGKC